VKKIAWRANLRRVGKENLSCYARADQPLLKELKKHLMPLERAGLLTLWADTDMNAGVEWEKDIHLHLNKAQIILLLVSPDFMASDYCYSTEMTQAMKRHESGQAQVIPILLRPVEWQKAPFAQLQALPQDARPILSSKWAYRDEGFADVAKRLREAVETYLVKEEQQRRAGETEPVCLTGEERVSKEEPYPRPLS
jgi:TIR domain